MMLVRLNSQSKFMYSSIVVLPRIKEINTVLEDLG